MNDSGFQQLIRGKEGAFPNSLYTRGAITLFTLSMVFAGVTANECHNALLVRVNNAPVMPSALFGIAMWLWWGGIAALLWLVAQRSPDVLSFSGKSLILHLSAGIVLGMLHLVLLQATVRAIGRHWVQWGLAFSSLNYETFLRFCVELALYGLIFALSGFLHLQSQAHQNGVKRLLLERQLSQAQLKALQMQIEPHFLFNTLNAITSLVAQKRNPEAMQTLAHLDTILRTTLQRRAPEKVPFVEELRVVESYLAIQQVRFADRLQVKIETTPEALEGLVPCFILQPIVENAIQHGIAPMEAGGLIETCVKRVGEKLWMQVRDNGSGVAGIETKGHGIGMQNTRERLAYFYPGMHEFAAAPLAAGGYEVTIQIPYERAIA